VYQKLSKQPISPRVCRSYVSSVSRWELCDPRPWDATTNDRAPTVYHHQPPTSPCLQHHTTNHSVKSWFLLFVFLIFLCCSYCYYIHLLFSWHVTVYRSYYWLDQIIQVSCSIQLKTRSFQRRSSQPSTYLGIKETKPDTTKPDTLWYYDTKNLKKKQQQLNLGFVTLYNIQLGNGSGLLLQPWGLYGAPACARSPKSKTW